MKVLEPKTFHFRNKKQNSNPDILSYSLFDASISVCTDAFRRFSKNIVNNFVNQTLEYSNEFIV